MYSGQIVPIIPNPDYLVTILRILFFSLAPHLYSRNTLEQFWGFWGSKYHWNIRLIPGGLEVAPSISYLLVEVQDTGCNWLVYRFITLGFGDIYNPLIEVITLVTGGKRFGRYEFVPDLLKKIYWWWVEPPFKFAVFVLKRGSRKSGSKFWATRKELQSLSILQITRTGSTNNIMNFVVA